MPYYVVTVSDGRFLASDITESEIIDYLVTVGKSQRPSTADLYTYLSIFLGAAGQPHTLWPAGSSIIMGWTDSQSYEDLRADLRDFWSAQDDDMQITQHDSSSDAFHLYGANLYGAYDGEVIYAICCADVAAPPAAPWQQVASGDSISIAGLLGRFMQT